MVKEILEFETEKDIIEELKNDPFRLKTYINAGISFFFNNKIKLAEKYLDFALFLSQKTLETYERLMTLFPYRKIKENLNLFKKLMELDKDILDTLFYLGRCYQYLDKNKLLKEVIEKLRRLYPEKAEGYLLSAEYYEEKKQIKKAFCEFEKAFELSKEKEDICFNVCQVFIRFLIENKKIKRAEEVLNYALQNIELADDYFAHFKKEIKKYKGGNYVA